MSASRKDIVEKVNAAFADNSVEGFLSFCADDVEWTMVGDKTVKGKDAIRKWMASMGPHEAPKFTVDTVIGEGDFVAAHGNMTMKDKDGKFLTRTATSTASGATRSANCALSSSTPVEGPRRAAGSSSGARSASRSGDQLIES